MTPQPQTPPTRQASTIRSHSPYSTGKGPIVNEGFVAARVRAIQGRFKQTKSPQYPEPRNDSALLKERLDRSIHSLKESPSFRNFNQLSTAQDLDNIDSDRSKRSQLSSSRKWQRSTSSLRSPYNGIPSGLQPSSDRKVHSMWDLHTRYQGSPHGGRKRYRDYSNLRRISAGTETGTSEIISPQPLSPYKQPVNVSQQNTDDSGFWSETQADQEHSLLVSNPRKSIAEALGNAVDVTEGQDEASTAWATEEDKPEYPFPAIEPFNHQPTPEVQDSEGAGPFDRKAYSLYITRTLPSFNTALTTASGSKDINDERPLRSMRGRRAAPDNTMVDSSEPDQQEEFRPLLPLKKRSRAATASYSGHSMSDTPRRATMHAPSIDPFVDHHTHEDTDEIQEHEPQEEPKVSLPLKKRSRAATASYSGHSVNDAPRRATLPAQSIDPFIDHRAFEDTDEVQDTLQDFKAYKATENSKLRQRDDGSAIFRDASEIQRSDKPESSDSRRSSATSRAPSIALSRPLSRVWRRLSTWRLGFGARQSELSSNQKSEIEAPNRTGTDLQPQANERSRKGSGRPRGFTYRGLLDLSTDSAASNIVGSETDRDGQPHTGSPKDQSMSSRPSTPNPDKLHVTEGEQLNEELEDDCTLENRSHHSTHTGSSHAALTERSGGKSEKSRERVDRSHSAGEKASEQGNAVSGHLSTAPATQSSALSSNGLGEGALEQGNAASGYPGTPLAPQGGVLPSYSSQEATSEQGNAASNRPGTSLVPQSSVLSSISIGGEASEQGNAASGRPRASFAPQSSVLSSNPFSPLTPKTIAQEDKEGQLLPQKLSNDPRPMPERSVPANGIASTPAKTPPARPSRPPPLSLNCSHPHSQKAAHSTPNPAPQQNPTPRTHSPNPSAAPPNETPSTPLAPTHRRPPLTTTYSHISLRPSPAHPTTGLSTPDPNHWTPSRGSALSRTYSSLHGQPTTPLRAQSPAPSFVSETETVDSVASSEAYASLRGSRPRLREGSAVREGSGLRAEAVRMDYELPRYRDAGCRDREQRIKRVKVVVSLDGGPDLVVDAVVERGREGGRAEWRVREGVRGRVEVEGEK